MRLVDGRAIAASIAESVATAAATGPTPVLAVVVPAHDETAAWYVRSIARAAARTGIECRIVEPAGAELVGVLDTLSADPGVHGIICQTPRPDGAVAHIAPAKDVDGANPLSLGRLVTGEPAFAPATAAAVLVILRHERVPLVGRRVVVVGRSTVVGKPLALLLLDEHATVTVCHSRTVDLALVCAEADILVAAVGHAGLIGAGHIRPGATVIDVGTNPTADGGFVGDVDPAAAGRAALVTPVPGGVGPVTTMMLLAHTVAAARAASDP